MPKLIEAPALMQEFNLYGVRSKKYPDLEIELNTESFIMLMYNDYLEHIKTWAQIRYPAVGNLNHCAFASLIMYLATGAYGGYGTENYEKEREVERLTIEFYKNCKESMEAIQLSIALIHFVESHLLAR